MMKREFEQEVSHTNCVFIRELKERSTYTPLTISHTHMKMENRHTETIFLSSFHLHFLFVSLTQEKILTLLPGSMK